MHATPGSSSRRPIVSFFLGLALLIYPRPSTAEEAPEGSTRKTLIEFGWDEPDTAFLRGHVAEMEQTPFDGCVFHLVAPGPGGKPENFTWLAWGRRAFTDAELQPALDDLRATEFKRFRANFLRFNTTPADLDWFDDYSAVQNNARLAARIAREGKAAGILFDVEEYQAKLFTFAEQRDAKRKSWDEYAAQARLRGREVMDAFQEGYPDLTVLLTFGYSLPRRESHGGQRALSECRYGLLAPFLDGMVDAAKGHSRLVDGYELSYGYKQASQFDDALRLMTEGIRPIVADPAKARRVVSRGFGLWMDYDSAERGWSDTDPAKNYFTPEAFESSLRHALGRTEEFVWIYTEKPRWWSPEGGRRNLPEPYVSAIRAARAAAHGSPMPE